MAIQFKKYWDKLAHDVPGAWNHQPEQHQNPTAHTKKSNAAPQGDRMTRTKALTLAVFTIWPFLYMILFMASFFIMFTTNGFRQPDSGMPLIFKIIVLFHLITMLEIPALTAIYIIDLFKTEQVAADKKVLWAIVLFMGNIVAMPIYWYLHIWKPIKSAPAA